MKQRELLQATVQSLLPLYTEGKEDTPSRFLREYPDTESVVRGLKLLREMLLPGRDPVADGLGESVATHLEYCLEQGLAALTPEIEKAFALSAGFASSYDVAGEGVSTESAVRLFCESLPSLRASVVEDVRAAYAGDPAAFSYAEVILAYPGVLAVLSYRIAHQFYIAEVPLIPRIISEWTHRETGVDIHPCAKIGTGFFIDHGSGVVIGQTAVIGNNVKIYQGAILGAKSFALDAEGNPVKGIRRHPTVEDNVVIYSNATVLGGETVVGAGSTIGGSVFLTKSVPPNSLVMNQEPKLQIKTGQEKGEVYEI